MKLTTDIFDQTRRLTEAQIAWILRHANQAIQRLGGVGEVRIKVIDDKEMASAHEEFAGVAGTTDVLTFDMADLDEHPRPSRPTVGEVSSDNVRNKYVLDTDILICIDEATRQAAPHGYPLERELLLYVVHGILHCVGFDDHDEAEFVAMHAMEDSLLAAIGVGPVFHRPRLED